MAVGVWGPRRIVPGSGSRLCDDHRNGAEHGVDANVAAALETACAQPVGGDNRRRRTFEPPVQKLVLEFSLPHAAWGAQPRMEAVAAAHRAGWDYALRNEGRWTHSFMAERALDRKLGILIERCRDPDGGSQAVAQLLASELRGARGGLCLRALSRRRIRETSDRRGGDERSRQGRDRDPVGGRHDRLAGAHNESGTVHPEVERFAEVIGKLRVVAPNGPASFSTGASSRGLSFAIPPASRRNWRIVSNSSERRARHDDASSRLSIRGTSAGAARQYGRPDEPDADRARPHHPSRSR